MRDELRVRQVDMRTLCACCSAPFLSHNAGRPLSGGDAVWFGLVLNGFVYFLCQAACGFTAATMTKEVGGDAVLGDRYCTAIQQERR